MEIRDLLLQSEYDETKLKFEDIAPIAFLHLLFEGYEEGKRSYDHIIVDEAQDTSPLEMLLLRKFVKFGSMTILGDLAQSIHSYRGVSNWEEFSEVFADDNLKLEEIERTYRSSYEIMTFANEILRSEILRSLNYQEPEPFERHAKPVRRYGANTRKDLLKNLKRELDRVLESGYATIAVICKGVAQCRDVHSYLIEEKHEAGLGIDSNSDYGNQLVILPAYLAKGVEFDACIIFDASNKMYPPNEIHGRLLYVAITRALHELVVLWHGKPSIHLPL